MPKTVETHNSTPMSFAPVLPPQSAIGEALSRPKDGPGVYHTYWV